MRLLFIGGTGIISTSLTRLALRQGHMVTLLNRGNNREFASMGAEYLCGDIRSAEDRKKLLSGRSFDAAVDFIAFTPEHVQADIDLLGGNIGQYVFISSASAYEKPLRHYLITESTLLCNPFWQYSRDKIACEDLLTQEYRSAKFPMTIVRPSHTYALDKIPWPIGGHCHTIADRLRRGKPIIVHGDGTNLWTITHADDLAVALLGLLGHPAAIGQSFHITSDEALTWNNIVRITAEAVGVEPRVVHIPSDMLVQWHPEFLGAFIGDKSESVLFDNSKIKQYVPWYQAKIPFHQGIRRALEYVEKHPECQVADTRYNEEHDALLARFAARLTG